jgi:FAD/FMN-containing dehydrogenase
MSQVGIEEKTVEELRGAVGGTVTTPDDEGYDELRRVWNGMIDRHPAVIVSCESSDDVVAALRFAREHNLIVSVRGGSHSTPGYSTCDGGVVIDLRPMNKVTVDPEAKTARCGGGAVWAELDGAAQQHGLAVTGGRVSDTGVGGLALGSGSGWLERKYGITAESLLSAEVVTADGEVVRASADENPDLFWGLRGGGGNFGVVTEFEFQLHPVGPIVFGGMLLFRREQAPETLRAYRDFIAGAPDEVGGGAALLTAPPEEFVPEEMRGQPAMGIVCLYVGPPEEGEQVFQSLLDKVSPVLKMVQPMPYAMLQQMLDGGNPHGIHEYFKIDWLADLTDDAIDLAIDYAERMPAPFAQVILAPMGGALGKSNSDMALTTPDAKWAYFCLTMWMDPNEDAASIAWTRDFAGGMKQFGLDMAAFPNFISVDEGTDRLRATYGPEKYERLVELKRRWDPENVFKLNQNISPV